MKCDFRVGGGGSFNRDNGATSTAVYLYCFVGYSLTGHQFLMYSTIKSIIGSSMVSRQTSD